MVGLILGVILFFVLFIFGASPAFDKDGETWKIRPACLLCLIGVVSIIAGCIKTVPTGQTGIVTVFGKVENYTLDAGVHFLAPWKSVTKMDNRTQIASIEMSCFSSDIQEVNIKYTVNYQINKQNAQVIYSTIGVNYYDTVMVPKIQEAVKGIFAKYSAEKLIESRGNLAREIEAVLVDDLAKYDIEVVTTSLEDIDFTDAFTNAVEAKQVAEQNKLKTQTEQETANLQAKAEAERQVIKAQADADSAILAAKADAEVQQIGADAAEYAGKKDAAILSAVGEQLNQYPNLIKYLYYQTWNGELPDTLLGEGSQTLLEVK
ncbi:MAG: prohibitin family protein [Lachnospiraceae bacterium]|nr:prohibitin family protein [Lachnospiraceae bacterium]